MTVTTADIVDAGTDSDLVLKVFGEKGASEEVSQLKARLSQYLRIHKRSFYKH